MTGTVGPGSLPALIGSIADLDVQSKERFEALASRLGEMTIAVTGLQSARRVITDETSRRQKMSQKSLADVAWQLSGAGKSVNSSIKELLIGIGRVLGQLDSRMAKNVKARDEHGKLLSAVVENLTKIDSGIQSLVQSATSAGAGSGSTPVTPAKSAFPPPIPGFSATVHGGTTGASQDHAGSASSDHATNLSAAARTGRAACATGTLCCREDQVELLFWVGLLWPVAVRHQLRNFTNACVLNLARVLWLRWIHQNSEERFEFQRVDRGGSHLGSFHLVV